jgi:hypothetical protein
MILFNKTVRFSQKTALLVAGLTAVVGIVVVVLTHASSAPIAFEPEAGTLNAPAAVVTPSGASGGSAVQFGSTNTCVVSSILVNSCGPWLGAAAYGNPGAASDIRSQLLYHEQLIGRQLSVVHLYNPVGTNQLSADAVYFANRANTYVYQNWKPTSQWANIASNNAGIDQMAASIKSLGSKKIFLTIFHEPENDVSAGGDPNCPNTSYKGSAGTVAEYKNMWAYVENRFNSDGVTNVVWVMNYMGYQTWDCLVPDMWPGNNLVDWVTWDPYSTGDSSTYSNTVGRFYHLLESDNTTANNFTSKPWGLGEWGDCNTADQAHIYGFDDQAKAALDANTYPRLKLHMIYDDTLNEPTLGCLTNYSAANVQDPTEQNHYNLFANDNAFAK